MHRDGITRAHALCAVLAALLTMVPAGRPARAAERSAATPPTPLETRQPAAARPWQRFKVDSQGSSWPQTDWSDYSNLERLGVTAPPAAPLHYRTPIDGDAARGRQLAFDRARGGSCVVCHIFGRDTPGQPGNVGPDLSEIGATRSDEHLFNYVYDPRSFNPRSIMPPWGAHRVYNVVEIKDIVAFLKTLKTPYPVADRDENPATRPLPVENRDNLDATENPAMFALDTGNRVYRRSGPRGKSCASCHGEPQARFKTWAARMPKYEPRLRKVLGVEEFLTRHARATTGENLLMEEDDNIGLSILLRNLANGTPMQPDVSSAGARQAAQRGNAMMRAKLGQLNMACTDCHVSYAGKWVRGQLLVQFKGTVAHFPTWRTSRGDIWDIRKRFQWCNVSIRANELPPDAPEYGDIELALAVLNRGEKINTPGIRH